MKLDLWNGKSLQEETYVYAYKTPLRISLIGGGTDMPEFVWAAGHGLCVSLSVNLGVAAIVQISKTEVDPVIDPRCDTPLTHAVLDSTRYGSSRLVRSVFMLDDVDTIGTGLGSSSAWVSSLSHALSSPVSEEKTFEIERSVGSRCGYQDHAAASYRSSGIFKFSGGKTQYRDLPNSSWLKNRVALYKMGGKRDSTNLLSKQAERVVSGDITNSLIRVRDLAGKFVLATMLNDYDECAALLREAWEIKKSYAPGVTNDQIDEAVSAVVAAGAGSAKILGAGHAGYITAFRKQEDAKRVDEAAESVGLVKVNYELYGRTS